ncbi:hypothetical protein J4423_00875 [Candidatus Pacearchaeota archaeon]|nr:hypothetical protein [Candidatus Pacearchaeota archaeon]
MASEERIQEAYQIMVKIDGMYHQGRFDEVNSLLRNMDLEHMTDQALITYLCVSKRAKNKLPYRQEFYEKVKASLIKRGRSSELPALLRGLE